MCVRKLLISLVIVGVYSQASEVSLTSEQCAIDCNCREMNASIIRRTSTNAIDEYHPVVLIHGIGNSHEDMNILMNRILEIHKGTRVFNLNCHSEEYSFYNLWQQVDIFGQEILAIGKHFPDGIHLIGYSQGGLIGRAVLQKFPQHNVRNFISLSAPQLGVYKCRSGQTSMQTKRTLSQILWSWTKSWIKDTSCDFINKNKYSSTLEIIYPPGSITQIYHSLNASKIYLRGNTFLPRVNKDICIPQKSKFKRGIEKLELMVLIGGPGDDVIDPWQSAHFEFFENFDGILPIVPLRKSKLYTKDLIGLKTLDKANRLIKLTVPDVIHSMWTDNVTIIDQFVLPYLD